MSTLSQFGGSGASKWVSGTTYALDTVVWSPTNYLTYIRIVAGAGTTDPSSDTTNWALFGPSKIKSIQRGTISLTSGTTSASATISSVNTAKATLTYLGNSVGDSPATVQARIALTNATTVTATRSATSTSAAVSYEVVEWW
ncbi:MAG TPA: hypothetical protein PKD87_11850 [Burkholderiaceae bacterium]|nr:hypothetical protein [Burkholderiaceae bacterium]